MSSLSRLTATAEGRVSSGATQIEPLTYLLENPEATSTASALIVVNPNTLEAELTAQNLPALPPGKVYAVWTLPEENTPVTTDAKGAILTGIFQVEAGGLASANLTVPVVFRRPELVAKMAITVEDVTSPQQHSGSVLLISQQ